MYQTLDDLKTGLQELCDKKINVKNKKLFFEDCLKLLACKLA